MREKERKGGEKEEQREAAWQKGRARKASQYCKQKHQRK